MEFKPLLNYSEAKQRQPISKRKLAGWCFYIALNVVLAYVIYQGLVMRGVL